MNETLRGTRWKDALVLGLMQFLSWGICTMSWRAVAQANVHAAILTDSTLATLNFFVIKRIVKGKGEDTFVAWLGYTFGAVLGTVSGIHLSLFWFGK